MTSLWTRLVKKVSKVFHRRDRERERERGEIERERGRERQRERETERERQREREREADRGRDRERGREREISCLSVIICQRDYVSLFISMALYIQLAGSFVELFPGCVATRFVAPSSAVFISSISTCLVPPPALS